MIYRLSLFRITDRKGYLFFVCSVILTLLPFPILVAEGGGIFGTCSSNLHFFCLCRCSRKLHQLVVFRQKITAMRITEAKEKAAGRIRCFFVSSLKHDNLHCYHVHTITYIQDSCKYIQKE